MLKLDSVEGHGVRSIKGSHHVTASLTHRVSLLRQVYNQDTLSPNHYRRAIEEISRYVDQPCFMLFSDGPAAAIAFAGLPAKSTVVAERYPDDENGVIDNWLMRHCRNFIIANSTYSRWAAWLNDDPEKIVIAPDARGLELTNWGLNGLVADNWISL